MHHRKNPFQPAPRRIFCTLVTLSLVFLLGSFCRLSPQAAVATSEPASTTPALSLPDTVPTESLCTSLSSTETAPPAEGLQLLLIGQDRQGEETRARSDCLILCTLRPESGQLVLTSFLRDLYVQIPGYGGDRLNAAYAYGGMELLRQTMEENFGITADGCVEVDFSRFPQIIDLLEGIDIHLRADEAEAISHVTGTPLSGGLQHLNGDQTLAYARIRKLDPDGDFSRTERQRKVIGAVIQRCREVSSVRLLSVVIKALPMISTDLDRKEILSAASGMVSALQDIAIVSQRIPADGTYRFDTIRNMDVILADLEAARKMLEETAAND